MKRMLAGLLFLGAGVAVPFGMVLQLIEPSFALSFLAYSAGMLGLAIGMAGASELGLKRRSHS